MHIQNIIPGAGGSETVAVGCSSEVPVACVEVCGVDDGCACEAVCGVDDGCACVTGDGTVDTSGSGSWFLPEERKEQTA